MILFVLVCLIVSPINGIVDDSGVGCTMMNDCNGHGACNSLTQVCTCSNGWGSSTDISDYKAPDCSKQICPSGYAWQDIPTSATTAHAATECSSQGICDRSNGKCVCFSGYTGAKCDRAVCPDDCSGHGRCISMAKLAATATALPLTADTTYEGAESTTTWDEERMFGCVCDSSWSVGLASGETQVPEFFGSNCEQRHCPSGDDPLTTADETDCNGVTAPGGLGVGASGNLCHVECSNRGNCDYNTGLCTCYDGYHGTNCGTISTISA